MGSSKKHKKHKSERREKYEEYSNTAVDHQQHPQHQRGLKLILKMGSNSTPEHGTESPVTSGPPTAAEAMMSAAPSSPMMSSNLDEHRERHKKSKKKKKKKDREKKHKHHKEKKHRGSGVGHDSHGHHIHSGERMRGCDVYIPPINANTDASTSGALFAQHRSPKSVLPDNDSSHDDFNFIDDDNSQPLPENVLFYAGITTDNSQSCRPVTKQIIPRKISEALLDSPASSSVLSSSLGVDGGSPTKPLPELLIPSPSTPSGSLTGLTPKALDAPKTPSSSSDSGREPRTCVLKLKQQKSPLNKMLHHLLRFLEKRDPHQFFAWPVTDDIAPGYSTIIAKPMDFSTMRQKIEDNEYFSLIEFTDDFKRMCENAIRYNHVDTVYHKAAKRLLQVGLKHLMSENLLRSLKPLSEYMRDLTAKELGFELSDYSSYEVHGMVDSADEGATSADEPTPAQLEEEEKRRKLRVENEPKTRFEPYVDDLTADEILAQVQGAAQAVKKRLSTKEKAHKMGFLRQRKDGTTSLNLLIKDENEGPEKIVSIGELVGKLQAGSGKLSTSRIDKRNEAKLVKSLNYGAFASFAPTFDSRFSNLSKDETQLVLRTYGDTASAEYAESILQFAKDSSYATTIANSLLDTLTNGEHNKAMTELYDLQVQNYEQQEVLKCFNHNNASNLLLKDDCGNETREQIEEEYEKYKNTRIDFTRLRSLSELGIDVSFLDTVEAEMKTMELNRRLQEHLNNNLNLIEKLRATQHDRLSQPLPHHLAHVPAPSADEVQLAQQITQQISDVAKKLPPCAIADSYSLRKAMGVSYTGLASSSAPNNQRSTVSDILQQSSVSMPQIHIHVLANGGNSGNVNCNNNNAVMASALANEAENTHANINSMMDIDDVDSSSGVDLEHELREFLENGSVLHAAANTDDSNIVAQLLMN